jgi:hypothetical protein
LNVETPGAEGLVRVRDTSVSVIVRRKAMKLGRGSLWSGLKDFRQNARPLIVLWLVAGIIVASTLPAEAAPPVNLTFDKTLAGITPEGLPFWEGTVVGDISGHLTTVWLNLLSPPTGAILHVEFDWIVDADDPDSSFTARLEGILNTKTGEWS